jgi:hypothetical protein
MIDVGARSPEGRRFGAKPRDRTRRSADRHHEAVIQAEIRRLAHLLRPHRTLPRDALQRNAGA